MCLDDFSAITVKGSLRHVSRLYLENTQNNRSSKTYHTRTKISCNLRFPNIDGDLL
jgi:hypothetical protein